MVYILKCFYFGLVVFFTYFGFSYEIACRDERDTDVDWYVNYKIPKIENEPRGSNLAEGKAYAYITASESRSWTLSTKSITYGSMIENTLKMFYLNKQKLSYLFYNDESPTNYNGTTVGHLKGVLVFDGHTGYWLIHSIPKFADDKIFIYPPNGYVNGQNILCVTFNTSQLSEICNQLLYSRPNIYARGLTDEVKAQLNEKARSLFTDNPFFPQTAPFTRRSHLTSLGSQHFVSFSKSNRYKHDLYSDVIAPGVKASLMTETWRNGSGGKLPPTCLPQYFVVDIVSVNMNVSSQGNTKSIYFKSTKDHSKWAISSDGLIDWVCIADMNRMLSQESRGGGALCFNSSFVKHAYQSIIMDKDQCPTSTNIYKK